jgi:hypothetical protein
VDANAVLDILQHRLEQTRAARFAAVFFHLLVPAKIETRPPPRFLIAHARPGVFLHLTFEMEA